MCIQIIALISRQLDGSMFCLKTKCQNKDAINLELGHKFRIDENSTRGHEDKIKQRQNTLGTEEAAPLIEWFEVN